MKILIESTVIIDYLNGVPSAGRVVETADDIITSSLCSFEALVGEKIKKEKGKSDLVKKAENFFNDIGAIPFTLADSRIASDIYAKLASRGAMVNTLDILIAAQAIGRGMTVISKDEDFGTIAKVSNLKFEILH